MTTFPDPMPFDLQPTLRGVLLDVRPLRPADHDAMGAAAADPLIWEQHPDKTRCTPEGFRRFFDQSLESGGALLVTRAGTEDVIGSSRFFGYDPAADEIEIGWTFLVRDCWGGRYNGELKRLMVNHAFRYVRRVMFLVGPTNFRSQHAVLKLGAVLEGERVNGAGRPSLAYCLTPERWAAATAAAG